jgi:hypothetical protein
VRKNTEQANNKMQLTRSGHSRWRPSQLILVLGGRRGIQPCVTVDRPHTA